RRSTGPEGLTLGRVARRVTPTAQVFDLATGNTTNLPAGSVRIRGATVRVKLPREPAPVDGPGACAVSLQVMAGGRRGASLTGRQLRPRVHRRPGRDLRASLTLRATRPRGTRSRAASRPKSTRPSGSVRSHILIPLCDLDSPGRTPYRRVHGLDDAAGWT